MIDRIKRDTDSNWLKAVNFIPKQDEVIIYDCTDRTRIKIGDGITKVNDLPFAEEETIIPISNITKVEDETIIMERKD